MRKICSTLLLAIATAGASADPVITTEEFHSYKTIAQTKKSPAYEIFLSDKACYSESANRTWRAAAFAYRNGRVALGCWGMGPPQPDGANMIACKLDENGDLAGDERVNCVVTERSSFQSTQSIPRK